MNEPKKIPALKFSVTQENIECLTEKKKTHGAVSLFVNQAISFYIHKQMSPEQEQKMVAVVRPTNANLKFLSRYLGKKKRGKLRQVINAAITEYVQHKKQKEAQNN